MATYDEADIRNRLARMDRLHKTAFAAACAERLWPLFERYAHAIGQGELLALRSTLDAAWRAAHGAEVQGMAEAQLTAEDMVPSDDGDWVLEMGYGQNAAAAVAYAVRTWLTDDAQEGAWGARQVYEAADYAAQHSLPGLDLNRPDAEGTLLGTPAVQTALRGLAEDLTEVETTVNGDWGSLRERVREQGAAWAKTLP